MSDWMNEREKLRRSLTQTACKGCVEKDKRIEEQAARIAELEDDRRYIYADAIPWEEIERERKYLSESAVGFGLSETASARLQLMVKILALREQSSE